MEYSGVQKRTRSRSTAALGFPRMRMGEDYPRAGDVIIHREVHSPAVYVLGRMDEPLQVTYKGYEEALAHATALAHAKQLDVWYTTDEQTFLRVDEHRASWCPSPPSVTRQGAAQ